MFTEVKSIKSKCLRIAIVAAAAAVAAPVYAQSFSYVPGSGTTSWVFPSSALSSLSSAGVSFSGNAPGSYASGTGTFTAPITSVTLDTSNNIQDILSSGGITLTASAVPLYGITGGALELANLDYSVATSTLYADVLVGSSTTNHVAVFTGTNTGATNVSSAGTLSAALSNLTITTTGESLLGNALGVPSNLQGLLGTFTYGTLTSTATFKSNAVVPEPSTYAVLAVGLAGLATARARRRT